MKPTAFELHARHCEACRKVLNDPYSDPPKYAPCEDARIFLASELGDFHSNDASQGDDDDAT